MPLPRLETLVAGSCGLPSSVKRLSQFLQPNGQFKPLSMSSRPFPSAALPGVGQSRGPPRVYSDNDKLSFTPARRVDLSRVLTYFPALS